MVVASSLYIGTLVINVKKHARGKGCRYMETFVANMETFDLDMERAGSIWKRFFSQI